VGLPASIHFPGWRSSIARQYGTPVTTNAWDERSARRDRQPKSRRRLGRRLRRALLQRGGGGGGLCAANRSGTELRVGRQRKHRGYQRLEVLPPLVFLRLRGAGGDRAHQNDTKQQDVRTAHGALPEFEAPRAIVTKIGRDGNLSGTRHVNGENL